MIPSKEKAKMAIRRIGMRVMCSLTLDGFSHDPAVAAASMA